MDDLKVEGDGLKKMIKLARKQPLSFAFCPGPKNAHVLMMHRRKKPEMLGKLARKEGESPKVAFGTFEVDGRTLEMTCLRSVPQFAKTLKKYLKSQKVTANVVVLDDDGSVLESDVEDLPDDPLMEEDQAFDTGVADDAHNRDDEPRPDPEADAQLAPESDPEEGTLDAKALVARLKDLQPAIAGVQGEVAAKLQKAMAGAVAQIKSGALEQADATITKLEAAVAKLQASTARATSEQAEPQPQPLPDLKALAQRAKAIQGELAGLAGPAREKLAKALSAAAQQIKAQNHNDAAALLDKIEAALAKVTGAVGASGQPDAAPYAQLRQDWIAARANLRSEIEALKSAIETATAGQPGLEEVAQRSDKLFEYISDINGDLEAKLAQLVNSSDPDQRAALKDEARQIIQSYRKTLDSAFFKAVDKNGFINTDMRAVTLSSLQQVNSALAA